MRCVVVTIVSIDEIMTLRQINEMRPDDARDALARCCSAWHWVDAMLERRPFDTLVTLHIAADEVWGTMQRDDTLEAFSHHPQIGADLESLRKKFAGTATWSAGEQAGVQAADEATLLELVEANREYLARFGYIFIVCATGKSAVEILALLRARLVNDSETELRIAAAEQAKIMHLRLDKLVE